MEVHPPHHTIETWRDFFVHMATICLGLLIAIGLEQCVEALHNHHQANELREALRADAEKAIRDAEANTRRTEQKGKWFATEIAGARKALGDHKPYTILTTSYGRADIPTDAAWNAARTGERASLLSPDEIKAYSEVDDLIRDLRTAIDQNSVATNEWMAQRWLYTTGDSAGQSTVSFGAKDDDAARLYLESLRKAEMLNLRVLMYCAQLEGAEHAILDGKRSLDDIQQAEAAQLQRTLNNR